MEPLWRHRYLCNIATIAVVVIVIAVVVVVVVVVVGVYAVYTCKEALVEASPGSQKNFPLFCSPFCSESCPCPTSP